MGSRRTEGDRTARSPAVLVGSERPKFQSEIGRQNQGPPTGIVDVIRQSALRNKRGAPSARASIRGGGHVCLWSRHVDCMKLWQRSASGDSSNSHASRRDGAKSSCKRFKRGCMIGAGQIALGTFRQFRASTLLNNRRRYACDTSTR